jgi:hypothetical protein
MAAGPVDGGTRLLLGANNSIGNFFNALQGNNDISNGQQDLASVFAGFLPTGFSITQPQVLRDSSPFELPDFTGTADRYVIIGVARNANTQESRIYISATQYTGASVYSQCLYWFNVNDTPDSGLWAASPRLGMSANALLLTANMYSSSDNSFQYAKLWMLPKTSVYNDPSLGTCPAAAVPANLVLNMPNSDGSLPFSVAPARSFDNSPMAYMINSLWNGGNSLTLWQLDTTDPTTITGTYGPVSTNSYSVPPNAQQAGSSALITTWDARIFSAVYQPHSGLWTAHATSCTPESDGTTRSCIQWYQIDPASFTAQQQGLVQLPGWYFYSGSIAANDQGDAVLGFSGSSANAYVGIYYTGHYHTDPPNTNQTIWEAKSGEGCYQTNDSQNSFGTHSDAIVDPIDSSVFWIHTAFCVRPKRELSKQRLGYRCSRRAVRGRLAGQQRNSPKSPSERRLCRAKASCASFSSRQISIPAKVNSACASCNS